jgi:uncharacterized membrane protein
MPFCAKCGQQVSGEFCASCGAKVAADSPPAASGSPSLTDNAAAALAYLLGPITGVLFLAWAPYNQSKNVRFHAFQSIFLFVAWMVIVYAFAMILPIGLGFGLGRVIQLAGLVLWLFLMYKTYNNEKIVLPVIGPLAEKQA